MVGTPCYKVFTLKAMKIIHSLSVPPPIYNACWLIFYWWKSLHLQGYLLILVGIPFFHLLRTSITSHTATSWITLCSFFSLTLPTCPLLLRTSTEIVFNIFFILSSLMTTIIAVHKQFLLLLKIKERKLTAQINITTKKTFSTKEIPSGDNRTQKVCLETCSVTKIRLLNSQTSTESSES